MDRQTVRAIIIGVVLALLVLIAVFMLAQMIEPAPIPAPH